MTMPEPLYTTIDGNVSYYDPEDLKKYLACPPCAVEACPEHTWPGNYREDAFPKEYEKYCFACAFWMRKFDTWKFGPDTGKVCSYHDHSVDVFSYDPKQPIVDRATYKGFLGYSGALWRIEYYTKEVVLTNNLWHGGTVPKRFQHMFPTNAYLTNPGAWPKSSVTNLPPL